MANEKGDIRSQSIKYKKLQTLMYHINKEDRAFLERNFGSGSF